MNLQTFLDSNGLVALAVLVGLALVAVALRSAFKGKVNNDVDNATSTDVSANNASSETDAKPAGTIEDFMDSLPPENSTGSNAFAGTGKPVKTSKSTKRTAAMPQKITRRRLSNAAVIRIADDYVAGKMVSTIASREGVEVKAIRDIIAGKSYRNILSGSKHTFPLKQANRARNRPPSSGGRSKKYADWAFDAIRNVGVPMSPSQLAPLLQDRMRDIGYVNADDLTAVANSIAKPMRKDKRFVNDGTGTYGIRADLK